MSGKNMANDITTDASQEVKALTRMLSFLNYLDVIRSYRPTSEEISSLVAFFTSLPKIELTKTMKSVDAENDQQARDNMITVTNSYDMDDVLDDVLFIRPIYLEDDALIYKIMAEVQQAPGIVNASLTERRKHAITKKIFETGECGGFLAFIEDVPVGFGLISTIMGALGKIEVYIRQTYGLEEIAHGLVGELVRLAMVLEYKSLFCKLTEPNVTCESVLRKKGFFAATDNQIRPLFEKIHEKPDPLLYIMPKVPKLPRLRHRRLEH